MKKYFNYLGIMAAAAMTLVSCAKEIDTVSKEDAIKEGIPFEFVANPETKTTIDGLQTKWAADDAVNLFHAVAGSTTYVSDDEFTIASEDLATGTFKGTLSESLASGSYDWYAVYPHSDYLTSIHNVGDNPARYYIGCRSDKAQVQTGNNSTAHLSGAHYPLYGKASAISYDAMPSVTLSNIASFVKIDVTNKNEEPLTVSDIIFTAPDGSEIVGQYNIDFAAEPLEFTMYKTYATDYATLTVESGEPIAKDETASFYIGIKPFTAAAGSDFKVSVNGYEKTIHTTKANTFESGKIKTVAFEYDYEGPKSFTWDLHTKNTTSESESSMSWNYKGFTMTVDKAASTTNANNYCPPVRTSTRFYAKEVLTITPSPGSIIDHVDFVATSSSYAAALRASSWTNASAEVSDTKVTVTPNNGSNAISAEISATCGFTSVIVYYKGELAVEYSITLDSTVSNGTIEASATQSIAGAIITLTATPDTGYALDSWSVKDASDNAVPVISDQFTMPASDVVVSASFVAAKTVVASKTSIDDVAAAGVSAAIESGVYELVNATDGDITVTFDGEVVTNATAADGDVLYDVAANTGVARSGWIKIAVAGGNTIQIDVNQLTGVAGVVAVATQTITLSTNGYTNGQEVSTVSGTTNWTLVFAKGSGSNAPKYYNTGSAVRAYGGNTVTVTANTGYSISSIEFTFASGEGSNAVTANTGTYNDGKWTGSIEDGASVVFTIGGTSGHRRISTVKVN